MDAARQAIQLQGQGRMNQAMLKPVSAPTVLGLRKGSGLMWNAAIANWAGPANRAKLARVEGWGRSASIAVIGCLAFAVGLLVYLMDRDASKPALIPSVAWLAGSNVFGALGGWLPSFVHTFAFSLLTAAVLPERSVPRYGACIAWFAVNVVFEVGQHPLVSVRLAEALQGGPGGSPLTQPLASYFVHGTFDPGDIVAGLFGALAAGAVLRLMHRGREENHA